MAFLSFMNTGAGRAIRVVVGLVLLGVGLVVGGPLGIGLAVFAVAPIATGGLGLCPVNPLLGQPVRSCAVRQPRPHRRS